MTNNLTQSFDYLFIGLGAANSLLVLKLHENGLLYNKKIAIIEPNLNNLNDRNFCFWATENEVSSLNLSNVICSKWNNIIVACREKQSILPLKYHHIRGINLRHEVNETLKLYDVRYLLENYKDTPYIVSDYFLINLPQDKILAKKVFDSRPPLFHKSKKNQSHILQSFYGWEVLVSDSNFDTSTMTMMDFEVPQNNFCQFMYVLPFTENKILFEITRFGTNKMTKDEAEEILKTYIDRFGCQYQILSTEKGVIPMSSLDIDKPNYGQNWIQTGASANMIKPTTGYAFHNMAIDAAKLAESELLKTKYARKDSNSRFKFYDGLLLNILDKTPHQGKEIFQKLFNHVPIKKVLTFLNEKSKISEDIFIFSKLPIATFLQVALKEIVFRVSIIPPVFIALFVTIGSLILYAFNLEHIFWIFLSLGFLSIGLSHGAIDHLIENKNKNGIIFFKFISSYLIKGALLGVLWIIWPDFALLAFIVFSAWHFGQADFREWNLKQGINSFIWGLLVLVTILFFHLEETVAVLKHIKGLTFLDYLTQLSDNHRLQIKGLIMTVLTLFVIYNKSKQLVLTVVYLLLSSMLPLLASFGIYFVLQHSLHGWRHLKTSLKKDSKQLFIKSLPFSLGGAFIILFFMLSNRTDYIGVFFIILSCISMPHVFSMNLLYKNYYKK